MHHDHREGVLYLNGEPVGKVYADGSSNSWGFGHFAPTDAFGKFAALFGVWSLLIHEDDHLDHSTREVLEELRSAEKAIDSLRAEVRWSDARNPLTVRQLTIDGSLIEWNQEAVPRGR